MGKTDRRQKIFYATADAQAASYYILNKMQPCFYVKGFYLKKNQPLFIITKTKMVDLICPSGIRYNHLMLGLFKNFKKKIKK